MSTGLDVFDTTLQKTNELLGRIEDDLNWGGRRNQSYDALRAVLHALRDRLPIEEAVHFSAQLPLLVKGIFYDGWDPDKVPIKMNRQEFLNYVNNRVPFDTEGGGETIIRSVAEELFASIDPDEAEKVLNSLPDDLKRLLY